MAQGLLEVFDLRASGMACKWEQCFLTIVSLICFTIINVYV